MIECEKNESNFHLLRYNYLTCLYDFKVDIKV